MPHERYSENRLTHQDPVAPVSQWQEWNDYGEGDIPWLEENQAREEKEYADSIAKGEQWNPPSWVPVEPEVRAEMNRIENAKIEKLIKEQKVK